MTNHLDTNFSFDLNSEVYNSKTIPKNIKQDGGCFGFFDDKSVKTVSNLIIDALIDSNIEVALWLMRTSYNKSIIIDLYATDKDNRTILHLLTLLSPYNIEIQKELYNILNRVDIKNYINLQDNDGNTIAHVALATSQLDLLATLIEKGADLKIKNKSGFYIALESAAKDNSNEILKDLEQVLESETENLFKKIDTGKKHKKKHKNKKHIIISDFENQMLNQELNQELNNYEINSNDFLNELVKNYEEAKTSNKLKKDSILNNLIKDSNENTITEDDKFLNELISTIKNDRTNNNIITLEGGSKNKTKKTKDIKKIKKTKTKTKTDGNIVTGKRNIMTYSEFSMNMN